MTVTITTEASYAALMAQAAAEITCLRATLAERDIEAAFAAGAEAMRDLVNAVLNTRVSAEQTMRDERLLAGDQELYRVYGERAGALQAALSTIRTRPLPTMEKSNDR